MSLWYCASPYSRYPGGIQRAYEDVSREAALLIKAGLRVYCPIAMTHSLALEGGIDPFAHELWMACDRPMMHAAKGLIVVMLEGWEDSRGVKEEIAYFRSAKKPIHYMTPGEVPQALLVRRQILGFCGVARSGKDTAAQALEGFTRIAFADGVREALLALDPVITHRHRPPSGLNSLVNLSVAFDCYGLNWDSIKHYSNNLRELLQRMGTEAGRNIHGDDCWIRLAQRKIEAAPGDVVITDCRFANEAQAIRDWGGTVIRIDRPGVSACNDHASERLEFEPDAVIVNDGTIAELHGQVRSLVRCEQTARTCAEVSASLSEVAR
jgi:hypothetical protein